MSPSCLELKFIKMEITTFNGRTGKAIVVKRYFVIQDIFIRGGVQRSALMIITNVTCVPKVTCVTTITNVMCLADETYVILLQFAICVRSD